jgi:hypothetical protein
MSVVLHIAGLYRGINRFHSVEENDDEILLNNHFTFFFLKRMYEEYKSMTKYFRDQDVFVNIKLLIHVATISLGWSVSLLPCVSVGSEILYLGYEDHLKAFETTRQPTTN